MDINTFFISLFGLLGVFVSYSLYNSYTNIVSSPPNLPVPHQVGKSKLIQSKTGDASLKTELNRRRAIYTIGKHSAPKETRYAKGSLTGAIETYFLTSICPKFICPSDILYDGGNDNDNFCPVLNGSNVGPSIDAGNAQTTIVCKSCNAVICCPPDIMYDGGTSGSELCPVFDGNNSGTPVDAGNDQTSINCNKCCPPDIMYDGGTSASDFCPVFDGDNGGPSVDAGNSQTIVCGH